MPCSQIHICKLQKRNVGRIIVKDGRTHHQHPKPTRLDRGIIWFSINHDRTHSPTVFIEHQKPTHLDRGIIWFSFNHDRTYSPTVFIERYCQHPKHNRLHRDIISIHSTTVFIEVFIHSTTVFIERYRQHPQHNPLHRGIHPKPTRLDRGIIWFSINHDRTHSPTVFIEVSSGIVSTHSTTVFIEHPQHNPLHRGIHPKPTRLDRGIIWFSINHDRTHSPTVFIEVSTHSPTVQYQS
ncbi:hypothetical protein DPMN_075862 [Dreissena polymorpha]|uniref:Uncharacterized protein n=1 Tax=Dreissena polymorpha TaxID=45954 RepID=A0A9D3YIZ3_DREPO|nr:hypothetical protein DPMN_075862 [Dreissena polymorpha]